VRVYEVMTAGALQLVGDEANHVRDEALTRLFSEHYRSLLGLARLLVDDRGSAEEVVQEAFIRLHRAWPGLRDPGGAAAYLRATVVNVARGQLRHRAVVRRHAKGPEPDVQSFDDPAVRGEERRIVAAAMRTLPRRQRECLVLRFYLDLSEREIAEALGVSPGSVKTHVHRGLAALNERLEVLR
jgi:RNA polymerase sigma-70 factor (sigma-E family)